MIAFVCLRSDSKLPESVVRKSKGLPKDYPNIGEMVMPRYMENNN